MDMIYKCFCQENEGVNLAYKTHKVARESYEQYLSDLDFLSPENKAVKLMKQSSIEHYLQTNRRAFQSFKPAA
jgi:hypothetical protein